MRIITGAYKGRIIKSVEDRSIRPVTDRVKTTIFNMLQNRLNLTNASVLDMFAGSGSLGFEALSRGAGFVVFVDDSKNALKILEQNAVSLNCLEDCMIVQYDAFDFMRNTTEKFDLIFADPPYAYEMTGDIPAQVFKNKILNKHGYLIIEHSKNMSFEPGDMYEISGKKEFGATHISFFIHPEKE